MCDKSTQSPKKTKVNVLNTQVVVASGSGWARRARLSLEVHGLALAVARLAVVAHDQLLPSGPNLKHGVAAANLEGKKANVK